MRFAVAVFASWLACAACSPPQPPSQAPREVAQPVVAPLSAEARYMMERINIATVEAAEPAAAEQPAQPEAASTSAPASPAAAAPSYDAGIVRIQVLLDRAHFSPGVINGQDDENMRKAIVAYERANGLPESGLADDALLHRLEETDAAPALVPYVLTRADVSGPFVRVPRSMSAQSRLRRLAYGSAAEAIAEKFHMDEPLLRALNPGVDFSRAGVEIVVANAGGELSSQVARIEIDKGALTLSAYDATNQLIAFYPVTISDRNTPSGELEVTSISFNPTYNYDADALPAFNDNSGRRFRIRPGPNNPVGLVWIALNRAGYGIHGTPEPSLISKTSSHGCIRLTNWDAVELGGAVRPGVPVLFLEPASVAQREEGAG